MDLCHAKEYTGAMKKQQFTQHRTTYGVDLRAKNDQKAIGWMLLAFVGGLIWLAIAG